jgi:hypothetical protein
MFSKILVILITLTFSVSFAGEIRTSEGIPNIGDQYQNSIVLNSKRKIILPQGIWEINNVYDDKDSSWHAPYKVITMINKDSASPFKLLVTRIFLQSASRWYEEDCEKKSDVYSFGHTTTGKGGSKTVCSQLFLFDNPQDIINLVLPKQYKFYWAKTLSKLPVDYVSSLPKNELFVAMYVNKPNDLYIKQEMLIDLSLLNSDGYSLKSRVIAGNTNDIDRKFLNWREKYLSKLSDGFFLGSEISGDEIALLDTPSTKNKSIEKIDTAKVDSPKVDAELKKIEDERKKLEEDRKLFNEQKILAEEKRKFEEEKRQFELSKQNSQSSGIKSTAVEETPKVSSEDKKQQAAIAKKLEQEEKQRLADEKKKVEEEKRAEAALAKKQEQEEKQRIAEEKKAQAALAKKQEQEEKQRIAEEKKKAEEERKLEAYKNSPQYKKAAKEAEERQARLEAQKQAEMQAQASKAIKVSKAREWVSGWKRYVSYLNIQSVGDEITITKVVMNRGRCDARGALTNRGYMNFPIRAQFGDTVKVDIDQCDLIEVEITTNLGTTSYSLGNN